MKDGSKIVKTKVVKIDKKMIIVFGLCLVLLISFAGCTGPNTEDPTIKRIKEAGVLKVGTCTPFEPMEYLNESGNIVGFDIDLANEIAAHLGVKAEFKDYPTLFDDISVPLENGEVDMVIAAITITLDRNKTLFSRPYLIAGQVIIISEANQNISNTEDLENKTIGVQSGTTGEKKALEYTNNIRKYKENFTSDAPGDLIAGNMDAIIVDYPVGAILVKDISGLKIIGNPITNEFYGIAVKKGENAFLAEIDSVIVSLQETGKMKELEDKWL